MISGLIVLIIGAGIILIELFTSIFSGLMPEAWLPMGQYVLYVVGALIALLGVVRILSSLKFFTKGY